ncbi:hypothetical protein GGX14DRAFT_392868 [Mycena pura]|uniref:Uncharacterized protein n=1 Tax=Mycena pura TaxID=153505 RepID=A0AAD6VIW0_9AGAR|nr:hypothetical protein GGX14DRAFT_392868 [Mycena pura]
MSHSHYAICGGVLADEPATTQAFCLRRPQLDGGKGDGPPPPRPAGDEKLQPCASVAGLPIDWQALSSFKPAFMRVYVMPNIENAYCQLGQPACAGSPKGRGRGRRQPKALEYCRWMRPQNESQRMLTSVARRTTRYLSSRDISLAEAERNRNTLKFILRVHKLRERSLGQRQMNSPLAAPPARHNINNSVHAPSASPASL